MRRIIIVLVVSIILGFVGLFASSTRQPGGVWQGFPFAYSYANPETCGRVNPLNGCEFTYDPLMIGLDYLVWFGIALAGISATSVLWNHRSSPAPM